MTKKTVKAFTLIAVMSAGLTGNPLFAADEMGLPRTSYGAPDLQGVWTNATITTLERNQALGQQLIVNSDEAGRLERTAPLNVGGERDSRPSDPNRGAPTDGNSNAGYNTFWIDPGTRLMTVRGEYRTSIIVSPEDGQIPYTPEATTAFANYLAGLRNYDGPEQRPLAERCLVGFGSTAGPPMLPVLYNNHYQIVQTPDYVMILAEMNHDARIIRLNSEHLDEIYNPWMGDSIGHWDGDTLVVETVNFHPVQSFRLAVQHTLYVPPEARVIERFTRVSADEIVYQFTIEDDEAYTQPWSGEVSMRPTEEKLYEYACHEGNYALSGILAGARVQDVNQSGN